MKIHLIYKIPRHSSLLGRMLDRVSLFLPWFIPPWRFALLIPWRTPVKAPHSITLNLYKHFTKRHITRLYDLYEKRTCHLNKDDILIACPRQAIGFKDWRSPDIYDITERTLDSFPNHPNTYLLLPYTTDEKLLGSALEFVREHGRRVILICSDFWTERWDNSPLRPHVQHMLRVNMAIDSNEYPLVKTKFNPPGRRRFLYIGHTAYYKNTKQLEAIAEKYSGFEGGHIGRGSVPGWKKISDGEDLNPRFMSEIANDYDIFVNTSTADAQATTVLEQMCFGFAIACTPQSGYRYESITKLDVNNTDFNIQQLMALQSTPETELLARARRNRDYAIQFHDWDTFCEKITSFIYGTSKPEEKLS